ncbi:Amino acid/polyamine transporter I [Penicillium argentinense]|uniref:Amino acid/polyamine transporter I n=1 Tax=Penicillium argentinense TaxID=1131581 RepID=A0A9W9JU84_9EURO|nr:Amino acid/polyamine transporter I [Penicillium argentinense]KAJ5082154.1 Amino acid/polyamine transporter I [Penicillium argentinense]
MKQVFWRITIFYVLATFIVGLIVPSNVDWLLGASGANTKASPLVVSIKNAGISGLPSVMNAIITISVTNVANSAAYGSSRTIQALAARGMAPKFLAYNDTQGRPIYCIFLQIMFGFLAFINEVTSTGSVIFAWLLALSRIGDFFIWGTWTHHGRDIKELVFAAPFFGVMNSYIGHRLNVLSLIAEFYVSVAPKDVESFFENYPAVPLVILLFIIWQEMDVFSNMRDWALGVDLPPKIEYPTWGAWLKAAPMRVLRSFF